MLHNMVRKPVLTQHFSAKFTISVMSGEKQNLDNQTVWICLHKFIKAYFSFTTWTSTTTGFLSALDWTIITLLYPEHPMHRFSFFSLDNHMPYDNNFVNLCQFIFIVCKSGIDHLPICSLTLHCLTFLRFFKIRFSSFCALKMKSCIQFSILFVFNLEIT